MVLFDNSRPPEEVVEEVCYLTTKLVDATPRERNLLRWGLTLVSNKFVKHPKKLKELIRVIKMNNDSIYGLVHKSFQTEKEDYGEEKRQEGEQKEKIKIATAMIKEGLPTNQISRITNLDISSINQLKLAK